MELENVAEYLVKSLTERQHATPSSGAAEGVVFFRAAECLTTPSSSKDRPGWYFMDMNGVIIPKERCPTAEADAFVLFDEAHCRGSDMKLHPDACAVLTLGPRMGREKLVQAAARLRQLERQQRLILLGTDEICQSIRDTCKLVYSDVIHTHHVIEWVLSNTAKAQSQV